jgi:hypothetical protein
MGAAAKMPPRRFAMAAVNVTALGVNGNGARPKMRLRWLQLARFGKDIFSYPA